MQQRDKGGKKTGVEDVLDSHKIRDAVISECLAACFQTLLAESGPEETIQAMGRYTKHSGMALACNARKRFGLEGNGFEDAGIPLLWAFTAISNRQAAMEIYEHGVAISCKDCPGKIVAPELCVANSHNVAVGICETINPDFESIFTDHLSDGGSLCRCVITKASERNINTLGHLVKTMRLSELSEEEVSSLRAHFISEILNTTTKAFVDLHGSEKMLEKAKPPARAAGLSLGRRSSQDLDLEKGDFADLSDFIRTLCKALGQVGMINESANCGLSGDTVECPLTSSPPEVCELLETFKSGMVEAIDPDSELIFDQMMTKGDRTCHWVVRKKATSRPNEEDVKAQPEGSALDILKKRFARGEISKEEYREQRGILLE